MQNYNGRQFGFFEMLTILDTALQIADFNMNTAQSSNDDIMKELQRQDERYLELILKNQKEILNLLSEIKADIRLDG